MKVLFIQNNGIQESIGVANLSGILKANGHETDLLLVSHTPDLMGAIRDYDPGLVAFSALTGVHHSIQRLARQVKQHFNVPVIVGGPHPTYSPEMIEQPGIDIICLGEGEHAMLDLAEAMEHDRDVTAIRNLHVKTRSGVIHRNPIRPATPLDELPFPDRELYYRVQVPARHADEAVHREHGLSVSVHVLPRARHSRALPAGDEIGLSAPEVGSPGGRRNQVHRRIAMR